MANKDRSNDTIEKLISEASRLLEPAIQPQEGVFFDSIAFRDCMRWLKRKIDAQMRVKGISIVKAGVETAIAPKFKEICLSLREITISHAASGSYGLELEACVELTDLLSGLDENGAK